MKSFSSYSPRPATNIAATIILLFLSQHDSKPFYFVNGFEIVKNRLSSSSTIKPTNPILTPFYNNQRHVDATRGQQQSRFTNKVMILNYQQGKRTPTPSSLEDYETKRRGDDINWVESSPSSSSSTERYNLRLDGETFDTGALSKTIYDKLVTSQKTGHDLDDGNFLTDESRLLYYAMQITADEALNVALERNGLKLADDVDVEGNDDNDGYGSIQIESVSWIDDNDLSIESLSALIEHESFESASGVIDNPLPKWKVGTDFSFIVNDVPAIVDTNFDDFLSMSGMQQPSQSKESSQKSSSIDEGKDNSSKNKIGDDFSILDVLDPDGLLRKEAKEVHGMVMPDEDPTTLADLGKDSERRGMNSPRGVVTGGEGNDLKDLILVDSNKKGEDMVVKRGYRVIKACDLDIEERNLDGSEKHETMMHVMESFVCHGCLIVDLSNGNIDNPGPAAQNIAKMWSTANTFFDEVVNNDEAVITNKLPPITPIDEEGCPRHAVAGYASYDDGNMRFMETRLKRRLSNNNDNNDKDSGDILPEEIRNVIGDNGVKTLRDAFDVLSKVSVDALRIAVAASTDEVEGFTDDDDDGEMKTLSASAKASIGSLRLVNELVDVAVAEKVGEKNSATTTTTCMSPYRLCRYEGGKTKSGEENKGVETFGAHTDTSFVTVVPVSAVAGLEVLDEDVSDKWLKPEEVARFDWVGRQQEKNDKQTGDDEEVVPWHARYVVVLPGELLQICTRNEVPASVHRVVTASNGSARLSVPILLRAKPGSKMDVKRYLGAQEDTWGILLKKCDGMEMSKIHDALQPSSYNKDKK